jgi:SAM-dependent methyltransferase
MPYTVDFESPLIRGVDIDPRPWNLQAEILDVVNPDDNLLDIGCGTALKLLAIAASVRGSVVGLEPDPDMRRRAVEHVSEAALSNVEIIEGSCEELTVADDSFDVVTCMMAPFEASEIHRVLRPGGIALLEQPGEQDKTVLKACFPPDEAGPRGLLGDLLPFEQAASYEQQLGGLFSEVSVRSGFWSTVLTPEGLDLLLAQTPTIRDFDPVKDAASVQEVKKRYGTEDGGVKITQHRLLITARKQPG